MFTKEKTMSLSNIGDGAAVEMFDMELQKVLDNIVDSNTKPDQVREITLKVKIKPDEDRNIGDIEVECPAKLAAPKIFRTKCILGKIGKKGEARELQSPQQKLFNSDRVVPIENMEKEV